MERRERQILFSSIHKTPHTDEICTYVQKVFGDKNVLNVYVFERPLSKSENRNSFYMLLNSMSHRLEFWFLIEVILYFILSIHEMYALCTLTVHGSVKRLLVFL